jgi:hypothetical protein
MTFAAHKMFCNKAAPDAAYAATATLRFGFVQQAGQKTHSLGVVRAHQRTTCTTCATCAG